MRQLATKEYASLELERYRRAAYGDADAMAEVYEACVYYAGRAEHFNRLNDEELRDQVRVNTYLDADSYLYYRYHGLRHGYGDQVEIAEEDRRAFLDAIEKYANKHAKAIARERAKEAKRTVPFCEELDAKYARASGADYEEEAADEVSAYLDAVVNQAMNSFESRSPRYAEILAYTYRYRYTVAELQAKYGGLTKEALYTALSRARKAFGVYLIRKILEERAYLKMSKKPEDQEKLKVIERILKHAANLPKPTY